MDRRIEPRTFQQACIPRPRPKGIDALTTLQHFAIVTYAIPAERLTPHVHPRFELDTIEINGQQMGLLSVVPFVDVDFTSAVFPFPNFSMGQTNYRIYIRDRHTGELGVWFLGTTLDSWTCVIPRHLWKLPWHRGAMAFDCQLKESGLYDHYRMTTESKWAPAELEITQTQASTAHYPGFPDEESALVTLTHPLVGYYFRRNGTLGSYRVWHSELTVRPAEVVSAKFGLLVDLDLVSYEHQTSPYSVLVQPETEFTVYLPPS